MTDEELIARLRENQAYEWQDPIWETRIVAADRIEALLAKLGEHNLIWQAYDGDLYQAYVDANEARIDAEAKLALMMSERDEAWKRAAHSEKMWGEAEVKLAKAAEALEGMINYATWREKNESVFWDVTGPARATLAEIKGESK